MSTTKENQPRNISESIARIQKQSRLILFVATTPFLILTIAEILISPNNQEKFLFATIFLLAFGIALIATRLVTHTTILRYANDIKEFDEAKSNFVSVASHQLKSPVVALGYTLEILDEAIKNKDWDRINKFYQDLHISADRLKSLTQQLLDVSRIESGMNKTATEAIDLNKHVEKILQELSPIAKQKELEVTAELDNTQDLNVYTEPGKLYNVLSNLLTNAFEYGYKDTPIKVGTNKNKKYAEVLIQNHAEPLSEDTLDDMFKKFNGRGYTRQGASIGGSGLGLYIAKTYVNDWGGEINVSSEDGLVTFIFTIPLNKQVL